MRMKASTKFESFIDKTVKNKEFKSLLKVMLSVLPDDIDADDECWDLLAWQDKKTKKSMNVHFGKFQNNELEQVVKSIILHKKVVKGFKGNSAKILADHII